MRLRMTNAAIAVLLAVCSSAVSIGATDTKEQKPMANQESAPNAAKDPFIEEVLRISPDLSIEKVFIPPRGVPAYVVMMRAKAQDRKPAVVLLHGSGAGEADKRQTFGLQ